jgi:hypothetical protein
VVEKLKKKCRNVLVTFALAHVDLTTTKLYMQAK